jgi:hypothetical protein
VAQQALSNLGPFDYEFWSDGSVDINGTGAAVSLCFDEEHPINFTTHNPYKHQCILPTPALILHTPGGLLMASTPTEQKGLNLPLTHILHSPELYHNKRILFATDSHSLLKALLAGPLQKFSALQHDYSDTWALLLAASKICKELVLQYVPAHVNLPKNEVADLWAKQMVRLYSREQQSQVSTSLPTLKSYLYHHFYVDWKQSLPLHTHHQQILGSTESKLSKHSVSCPLQCLFSRWHVGKVESIGKYPQ